MCVFLCFSDILTLMMSHSIRTHTRHKYTGDQLGYKKCKIMVLLTRLRDLTLKDCTYYDFDELVKETVLDHVAMSHHIRTAFEIENV